MPFLTAVETGDMEVRSLADRILRLDCLYLLSRDMRLLAVGRFVITSSTSVASQVLSALPRVLLVPLTIPVVLAVNLDFVIYPVFILAEAADGGELQVFRSNHTFYMD